ncbi:MAG: hypothetical protein J6V37_04095, partial [Clostridia bacterium]|nr:hypothetical protein [Clostridia bacterium]
MSKKYKMGFDIWALVLFVVIMIPNIIWFAIPAPNDILRTESITKIADTIASISQVVMLVALCVFINTEHEKRNQRQAHERKDICKSHGIFAPSLKIRHGMANRLAVDELVNRHA